MSWVKLDDQFSHHPKIMQAGPLAGWLHVCALCYCASYLTDGFVPNGVTNVLADYANIGVTSASSDLVDFGHDIEPSELVDTLVSVGLWERVNNGYLIHDYLEYNPSKADVLAERAKNAERQGRYQAKHARNGANNGVSNGTNNASVTGVPSPSPSPSPFPKEDEGGSGPAWQAFTKARGVNLSASDSQYIAEFVTLYGDAETAQAIVYCDKNKRDNFLRINYIQTILSSWQAEGTLGLHTPEYEANKSSKRPGSNGRHAEPESNREKLDRVFASLNAEESGNGNPV